MIYNNGTLQRRFVAGRYTAVVLSAAALLLWVVEALLASSSAAGGDGSLGGAPFWGAYGGTVASFLLYAFAAYLQGLFVILESRTPWLGALFLFVTALLPAAHGIWPAAAVLGFMLAVTMLQACHLQEDVRRRIFASFFIIGCSSLLMPQFVCLLPPFFAYFALVRMLGVKEFLSALLGLATPYWLLFGVVFVFPSLGFLTNSVSDGVQALFVPVDTVVTLPMLFFILLELVVMVASVWLFVVTSSPAKPMMRNLFIFFVFTNLYLWLLAWLQTLDDTLLLAWRLPGFALMLAYLFTVRLTKMANICFIIIGILLLLAAALNIWTF